MKIAKNNVPVKIDGPGAVARQETDFGNASGYGTIGGELFKMDAGVDLTPLLQGLEEDLCHAPHWGYMIEGELVVTYHDDESERVVAGDLFYWPPGHTVRSEKDAEFVMFSPQDEHTEVMDHVIRKISG